MRNSLLSFLLVLSLSISAQEVEIPKWSIVGGFFTSISTQSQYSENCCFFTNLPSPEQTTHLYLGLDRSPLPSFPYLTYTYSLSYFSFKSNEDFPTSTFSYQQKVNIQLINSIIGARIEPFLNKKISPFIGVGFGFSVPLKFEQILDTPSYQPLPGGYPHRQVSDLKLGMKAGYSRSLGVRFIFSEKVNLLLAYENQLFFYNTSFEKIYDLDTSTDLHDFFSVDQENQLISLSLRYGI